jgi:hypothetical protein
VREKQRQEEERVRRETEEGLKAFRERQKTGAVPEAGDDAAAVTEEAEAWGVGKKRKRAKDKELKGVRRRVSEGNGGDERNDKAADGKQVETDDPKPLQSKPDKDAATEPPVKKGLALVGYGSDSDED